MPLVYRRDEQREARNPGPPDGRAAPGAAPADGTATSRDPQPTAAGPAPKPPVNVAGGQVLRGQAGLRQLLLQQAGARPAADGVPQDQGDFSALQGDWTARGDAAPWQGKPAPAEHRDQGRRRKDGKSEPLVGRSIDGLDYSLEPLSTDAKPSDLQGPARQRRPADGPVPLPPAAGLRREGLRRRVQPRRHRAVLSAAGRRASEPDYAKQRVDAEVLRTELAGVAGKWYFSPRATRRAARLRGDRSTATTIRARSTSRTTSKVGRPACCRTASRSATATRPTPCLNVHELQADSRREVSQL